MKRLKQCKRPSHQCGGCKWLSRPPLDLLRKGCMFEAPGMHAGVWPCCRPPEASNSSAALRVCCPEMWEKEEKGLVWVLSLVLGLVLQKPMQAEWDENREYGREWHWRGIGTAAKHRLPTLPASLARGSKRLQGLWATGGPVPAWAMANWAWTYGEPWHHPSPCLLWMLLPKSTRDGFNYANGAQHRCHYQTSLRSFSNMKEEIHQRQSRGIPACPETTPTETPSARRRT